MQPLIAARCSLPGWVKQSLLEGREIRERERKREREKEREKERARERKIEGKREREREREGCVLGRAVVVGW